MTSSIVPPPEGSTAWDALALAAYHEYDDILDFVWKTPSFVESQEAIELKKLRDYYSDTDWIRDVRWALESRKLYEVFPKLMAHGNLFMVVSAFEVHVLRLAKLVESTGGTPLSAQAGQGFAKVFSYLRSHGIDAQSLLHWPQADAAMRIRNCLTHANGILAYSRDETELRRIVASRTYLTRAHRVGTPREGIPDITIAATELGDQLRIPDDYPFLATAYLRNSFMELCSAAKDARVEVPPHSREAVQSE